MLKITEIKRKIKQRNCQTNWRASVSSLFLLWRRTQKKRKYNFRIPKRMV